MEVSNIDPPSSCALCLSSRFIGLVRLVGLVGLVGLFPSRALHCLTRVPADAVGWLLGVPRRASLRRALGIFRTSTQETST